MSSSEIVITLTFGFYVFANTEFFCENLVGTMYSESKEQVFTHTFKTISNVS